MSTLESILSGEREPAPVEATTTVAQPEPVQEQPQSQPDPSSDEDPQPNDQGMVPVAALQATREKAKRKYTETVSDFEKRMAEAEQRNEQRFAQLIASLQPKQAQPEPAPAPDFWDKPEDFVRSQAVEMVSPLQQQMLAMAREVAEVRFQPDTVKAAEEAFNNAARTGQIDPVEYRRIQSSPNPFAAAVQWHQKTAAMAEIGSDPAAYKAKLAEEIRAQVMAELQQGNTPQAAETRPAPVMPGNFATGRNVGARSGPAYSGPPRLEDILGSRR